MEKQVKLVLISGKQGSGKSSLARDLGRVFMDMGVEWERLFFAKPLYDIHDACLPVMKKYGIIPQDTVKEGPLLQLLGTEWGRKTRGENVWVDIVRRQVDALKGSNCFVTIEDARFENEFDAFPDALRIRLDAPEEIRKARAESWRENTQHQSEIALDNYHALGKFDMTLDTSGRYTKKENLIYVLKHMQMGRIR